MPRAFLERIYSSVTETIHAKLKLGAADWAFLTARRNRLSCLVNMDGSSQDSEPRQKEKAALALAKDLIAKRLRLWYAGGKILTKAKADVEHKVATMIDVYRALRKSRLARS